MLSLVKNKMMKFEMKDSKHACGMGDVCGIHANRTMQIGEYISKYMILSLSLSYYKEKEARTSYS